MTLNDIIDLRELAAISGWGLRRIHDFIKDGTVKARRTGGKRGTWITTRREAEKLAKRPEARRGPKGPRKPKENAT